MTLDPFKDAERIVLEQKNRVFDKWLETFLEEHAEEVEAEQNQMSEEQ